MLKKIYFPMIMIICTITSQMQAQSNFEHDNKTSKRAIKKPFYLITGMNFNKQNISMNDYASRFNYDLNDYQKSQSMINLFTDIEISTKSAVFIGAYNSNVDIFIDLRMNNNTFFIDKN